MEIAQIATPGELITDDQQFMRGHGTFIDTNEQDSNRIYASVCGTVERVNKLISVRPIKCRYEPEIGDVVVGRILDVGTKRWKVDIKSRQDGILQLSSVTLPGAAQRRRQESDELQMREFFAEGDMLVAEVQQFFGDGAVALHTRSLKYGKLKNGMVYIAPSHLIKRSKTHFHTLPMGIDVIIGVNGVIWIRKHTQDFTPEQLEADPDLLYSNDNEDIDDQTREAMARVRNCINALCERQQRIDVESLMQAYEHSLGYAAKDLLLPDLVSHITTKQ